MLFQENVWESSVFWWYLQQAMGSGAGSLGSARVGRSNNASLCLLRAVNGLVLTLPGALGKSSLPPLSCFTCHLRTTPPLACICYVGSKEPGLKYTFLEECSKNSIENSDSICWPFLSVELCAENVTSAITVFSPRKQAGGRAGLPSSKPLGLLLLKGTSLSLQVFSGKT